MNLNNKINKTINTRQL